jgi:hypothetical protein
METGLLELDAQVAALDGEMPAQPALDDVVYEMTTSQPLVTFVADADSALDPEALDPAIFVGLMAP